MKKCDDKCGLPLNPSKQGRKVTFGENQTFFVENFVEEYKDMKEYIYGVEPSNTEEVEGEEDDFSNEQISNSFGKLLSNEFTDKEKSLLGHNRNSDLERKEAEEKIMAKGLDQSNEESDKKWENENGNAYENGFEKEDIPLFTPVKENNINTASSTEE